MKVSMSRDALEMARLQSGGETVNTLHDCCSNDQQDGCSKNCADALLLVVTTDVMHIDTVRSHAIALYCPLTS